MTEVRKTLLIVEDEGIIALDLKRRVMQAGYDVSAIASDMYQALESIQHVRPDLVLMDIRIRGKADGVETAGRIRRQFHLPVFFVIGDDTRAL